MSENFCGGALFIKLDELIKRAQTMQHSVNEAGELSIKNNDTSGKINAVSAMDKLLETSSLLIEAQQELAQALNAYQSKTLDTAAELLNVSAAKITKSSLIVESVENFLGAPDEGKFSQELSALADTVIAFPQTWMDSCEKNNVDISDASHQLGQKTPLVAAPSHTLVTALDFIKPWLFA